MRTLPQQRAASVRALPQQRGGQRVPAAKRETGTHLYIDYTLIFVILFLLAFGLVVLYSASYYEASMDSATGYDPAFYLKKQATWMAAGTAAMLLVAVIPYEKYRRLWFPAYLISLGLVVACLFFDPVNGARRWVKIAGFSLQPAEIVKIVTILMMADMIARFGTAVRSARVWLFMLSFPTVASLLIFGITRNLSSALIVAAIAMGMFFVARQDYLKFILFGAGGVLAATGGVYAVIRMGMQEGANFRFRRIVAWLDPEKYAKSVGYQTVQALYAIGSGGLFGKGLGKSMQKLGYIPEVQNDMIFSIVCEELGIFGAAAIILMFVLLCWRLMAAAANAKDAYGAFLAVGVFCHIAVQVLLNIAVVTNTIPNTGVTLPFISYGGSALIFTMAEMGMVLNVASRVRTADR
nr:FtsW/RodA/SpoVE family cell cycle protein [Lachnoclostridium sp. Marseille-P6806]